MIRTQLSMHNSLALLVAGMALTQTPPHGRQLQPLQEQLHVMLLLPQSL